MDLPVDGVCIRSPKNKMRLRDWLRNMNRLQWKPTCESKLCGKQFEEHLGTVRHYALFFHLMLMIVYGCPLNSTSNSELGDRVWQICDGHELTRAISDACGQRPYKGSAGSATQTPRNHRHRRYRRMVTVWMLHLSEVDRRRVEGKEKLYDDVADDVMLGGRDKRGRERSNVAEKRMTRSTKNYWIRVLNQLYEKCCTKGCVEEDLIQLC
ncbi:hypothetical protein LSH36_434g02053 [Paralvinella palmiformis]|uniref:C2H2-type domain-containing protein n=1 Tax=Paralvinella palmiformis TaxID=53620 RepID=A0AAD9JC49_9ANNE|nr:hypothetical protein LSH36_434g02053 [Paralvinella palmiformis]